jgi:hypothetical protein
MNERMNEQTKNTPVLKETWHTAETITSEGIYQKLKFREVEQITFYLRPAREWFIPCPTCQKRLKITLAQARWILGNKEYDPPIELNSVKDELDDDSWVTLDEHKATPEEIKRIGIDGWEKLS